MQIAVQLLPRQTVHPLTCIIVAIVSHSYIWSEMTGSMDPTRMIYSSPMDRVGQTDEIAQLVLFLASRASTFITGVAMPIDGGFMESASQR